MHRASQAIVDEARKVLGLILELAVEIKKDLGEGGSIDWVLDALQREDTEEETTTGKVVRELVGEGFMEVWAGSVVESWNDCVEGFSLLRMPVLRCEPSSAWLER